MLKLENKDVNARLLLEIILRISTDFIGFFGVTR